MKTIWRINSYFEQPSRMVYEHSRAAQQSSRQKAAGLTMICGWGGLLYQQQSYVPGTYIGACLRLVVHVDKYRSRGTRKPWSNVLAMIFCSSAQGSFMADDGDKSEHMPMTLLLAMA